MAEVIHDPDARQQIVLQIASHALHSGHDPELVNAALKQLLMLPAKSQRDLATQLAELAAYAGKIRARPAVR